MHSNSFGTFSYLLANAHLREVIALQVRLTSMLRMHLLIMNVCLPVRAGLRGTIDSNRGNLLWLPVPVPV